MSDSTAMASGGMGFVGWLTLILVVLKLNPGDQLTTPVADWSWWLVFTPMLVGVGVSIIIIAVVFAIAVWADK